MSKYGANLGKPLSGISSLSPSLVATVGDSIASSINSGALSFTNITVSGGTIDGTIVGGINPVIVNATTIVSGNPTGIGYSVCFYGDIVGDSCCWIPVLGQWNIQGDLQVRDISDLGNIRINTNTISSTNSNGNINITPSGSGILYISSGILTQTTGNLIFNTSNIFQVTAKTITSTSSLDTTINATNGNISLVTGTAIPNYIITSIGTGSSTVAITTSTTNLLVAGEKITISGTNSVPIINGVYTIISILSTTRFTINATVNFIGTTGTIVAQKNIYLTASNNVIIPTNVPLFFGNSSSVVSDNTNLTFNSTNIVVDGNFIVNGTTTSIDSTTVVIEDPVFNIGGNIVYSLADTFDRGVSFQYYNGATNGIGFFGKSTSSGCFTYIPIATQVSANTFTGVPGCAIFGGLTTNTFIATNSTIGSLTVNSISNSTSLSISSPSISITSNTELNIISPVTSLTGNLTVSGSTSTGNLTVSGSTSTGNLTVSGSTSTGNLTVSGSTNLSSLTVSGSTNLTGNLTVNSITSTGTLTITSPSFTLSNSGTTTLNTGILNVNSTLMNIVSPINVTGNITVTSNSNVSGTSTTGNLVVTGSVSGIRLAQIQLKEHLSINSVSNPGNNTEITFINTIGSSITYQITNIPSGSYSGPVTVTCNNSLSIGNSITISGVSNSFNGNYNVVSATTSSFVINFTGYTPNVTNGIVSVNTTGILLPPSFDGFEKKILCSSISNGKIFSLFCPTGTLLDPSSGTTVSKFLDFEYPGQSVYLIYDLVAGYYIPISANISSHT
jgi:hypothetical protein